MIEIDGLTRRFGEVTAVDGLTLTIREGEVFGLLALASRATFQREEILTRWS
jgi:ABC-type uncharacterized transport system ATPase subunit